MSVQYLPLRHVLFQFRLRFIHVLLHSIVIHIFRPSHRDLIRGLIPDIKTIRVKTGQICRVKRSQCLHIVRFQTLGRVVIERPGCIDRKIMVGTITHHMCIICGTVFSTAYRIFPLLVGTIVHIVKPERNVDPAQFLELEVLDRLRNIETGFQTITNDTLCFILVDLKRNHIIRCKSLLHTIHHYGRVSAIRAERRNLFLLHRKFATAGAAHRDIHPDRRTTTRIIHKLPVGLRRHRRNIDRLTADLLRRIRRRAVRAMHSLVQRIIFQSGPASGAFVSSYHFPILRRSRPTGPPLEQKCLLFPTLPSYHMQPK